MITTACIHYLKYLPNRRLMHGGLEKWSDSIFWNFSLLGENVPRFLLVVCFPAPHWAACSAQKVNKKRSRSIALDCSALPLSFQQDLLICAQGCWVLQVPDQPRSQPSAWQWHGRDTSSRCRRAGHGLLQEGQNLGPTTQKFCTSF